MILANHGIVSSSGGEIIFDTDALAFISAISITDNTQKTAINTLVTDLKTGGIWSKKKAIYPFLGGTGAKHRYNLKSPTDLFSDFYMTFYGGGTHSANGWQCNGVDTYADTSIIPNFHMTSNQNDMCFSAYVRDTVNNVLVGADNNHRTVLAPNRTGVGIYIPLSSTDGSVGTPAPTGGGFYMNTRLDNTTVKLFKNGSLIHSRTNVTTGLDNVSIYLGARHTEAAEVYSNNQIAFASIGSGLTDAEALVYYNAVQNYQSILSRQV